MRHSEPHSSNLKHSSSISRDSTRLIVLVAVGSPLAVLVVVAIAAYVSWGTPGAAHLPLGGAILLLGLLAIGAITAQLLRQFVTQAPDNSPPGSSETQSPLRRQVAIPIQSENGNLGQAPVTPSLLATASQTPAEVDLEALRTEFNRLAPAPFEVIAIHEKIKLLHTTTGLAGLFGYEPGEVADLTLLDLTAPEAHGAVLQHILTKYDHPYQVMGRSKGGDPFPLELLSQILFHQGKTLRVMGLRKIIGGKPDEISTSMPKTIAELEGEVKRNTSELRYANERLQLELNARKQAEEALKERNRELTILQSASAAITSRLDLRYVLDTVSQEMTKLPNVESCAIFEWKPVEDIVVKVAEYRHDGWWDSKSRPEIHLLTDYPLLKSVLEEQVPEQMTINQRYVDPAEIVRMKEAGVKTRLLLPMIFQQQALGLVRLEDSQAEHIFSYQEISLAKLLANQAASAIENARLYGQLQQHLAELITLNEINQAMISSLDLQAILATINEHLIQLLKVSASSVALYDPSDNKLWFAAASGEGATFVRDKRLPLGEGVVGWVITHGEALLIPEVGKDPRFYRQFDSQSGFTTHSILCVPLQTKGKTIGAIEAINKKGSTFEQADLRLLKSVAAAAATVIENVRLFEQTQEEIKERQRAEAALEQERARLAERVKERTAELSRANSELARASRHKDEFLASMSHELRTPLNTILGSAEILQSQVFGPLEEKQAKYVKNVDESGRHLLSLINDILDLSKIEAGKMELTIRPVSIQSICEASLRLVKELAHKKQIQLQQQLNTTVTALQADERRLKQILVNLLSNAVKFTPEGGQVGLEVNEETERQAIHFTVWDTGIGISQEDMSRLFQPFVQLDSALSRQYAGTGLGLSLVSRMVEMHGGGISVTSEVGQGSRFTVSFPYSGPAELAEPPQEKSLVMEAPGVATSLPYEFLATPPLVLLAEDNEVSISMFTDYLQVQKFRVVIARNGYEVLERSQEEKPDIILMDSQMPEMDGLEATRRIRANPHLAPIPVIMMTALAMPGDREQCLAAGANEYLSKPINLREMVKTISAYLVQS